MKNKITLTKHELVKRISMETGLIGNETRAVIDMLVGHVIETLASGGRIEFRGFGRFDVVARRPRTGRDLNNGGTKPIKIPACAAIRFRVSKSLRKRMNKLV